MFMNFYLTFGKNGHFFNLFALKNTVFQPLSERVNQHRPDLSHLKKRKEGENIAKKSLSKKEKLFCLNYAFTPNGRDAAKKSGYSMNPQAAAAKLLSRRDITDEIAALTKANRPCRNEAAAGYRRLAFGSVADALSLIFCEDPPTREQLEEMDLFSISEIKRPKGGGLEIKFFDRLKPLERLAEMSTDEETDGALGFYQALENSAQAIKESVEDE